MGLRKGQKELVEQYRGGHCAVPAIPGGGKTHCLSLWAAGMIAQGLNRPGKILIVTYMNSAVNNFKQRISSELEKRGINGSRDYHVSTIHGLCLQIIKEKPDYANISDDFDIIDGTGKLYLLNNAVEEWKSKHDSIFRYYIDEGLTKDGKYEKIAQSWQDKLCSVMGSAVGHFKGKGISPEEAVRITSGLKNDSLLKHSAFIYGIYDKRLKSSGLLDFDDMLQKAKQILYTDEELLEKFRKRYRFVCEDEAQDSNLIQSEILSLIANGNLLRVGDSNQAICGTFTNSDYKYFRDFCEQPQTAVYGITQSSRSTYEIIDLANYLVKYVNTSHPVEECKGSLLPQYIEPVDEMDAHRNPVVNEYSIKTAVFNSWQEEMEGITRYVSHMLDKHPDKSFAVLMPTSFKLNDFAEMLKSGGIPFEELDSSMGVKARPLKLLGRILSLHYSPDDRIKLAAVINDCFLDIKIESTAAGNKNVESARLKNIEVKRMLIDFIEHSHVQNILYPQGGEIDIGDLPSELVDSDVWRCFTDSLGIVREILELPSVPVEKLILDISYRLGFGREDMAIAQKVAGDVKFMSFKNPNWQLCDLADELLGPRSMYNYFAGIIWDLKGYEPSPGVVTLSTCHKSKGLEWDVVFIAGLSFADFPVYLTDKFAGEFWFLKQQYKNPQALMKAELDKLTNAFAPNDPFNDARIETISERARLLYVGITRAKEYLFLSGFHSNAGKRNEIQPSAYLGVLKRHIDGRAKCK